MYSNQKSVYEDKPIGMMDSAYFVGRTQLLNWLNTFFDLNLEKIEQVCTGAIHCQIMDALYPGVVPLHKVNFNAKYDYEYIKNYKILQSVFKKMNIPRMIEVNKLIKGKYQDNLEFLQWMKKYFDTHWNGREYDAAARRNEAIRIYNQEHQIKPQKKSISSIRSTPAHRASRQLTTPLSTPMSTALNEKEREMLIKLKNDNERLSRIVADLNLQIDNLEKERNFYFEKLRDVEVLCEDQLEKFPTLEPFIKEVQKILYATDEEFTNEDEQIASSSPENVC